MTTAVATPYLVADSAHVTIMRSLASSAFGTYNLQVPEDIELEDIHTFAAPGNELGYVASLVKGRRVGGWARRFVRCDVSVTAKDDRDRLRVSESNVDAVLREARDRTAGDFFLESSITQAGLGPWVPLVDFAVGDIVNVEIFGRVVQLPVTRIEPIVDDAVIVGWTVHVGGQVVGDAKAREEENAEIRRALVRDQRDLAGIEAQVSKAVRDATDAKSTADDAQRVAGDAMRAVVSAEGLIQRSLAASTASVAQGHVFAQEAYESYEKAQESYVSALSALDDMERLLGESDSVLQKNEQLARDIKQIHSQVSVLGAQVRVASQQMGALLGTVSGNVALSLQYSEEARDAVDDAAELRRQVEGLVVEAEAAISEGREHVQSALSHSQSAAQAVSDAQAQARKAKAEADRAVQTLDSVKSVKAGADSAAKAAGERLADLQREAGDVLSKIDAKQNEILALHQEVLEKHGEVLTAHETAIRAVAEGVKAAGAAAGSASMGAMYAQLTAEDAAKAASSALDAAEKNKESIALLAEAQEKLEEASKKLAAANDENAKAIATLKDAQKLQDKINQDLVAADEKLTEAQRKLEAQTANLKKAVELTNQAVRAVGAAAGFAAQTGMHAADVGERATRTAESALEAHAHLQEVVEIHGDVITKASQTATDAKSVADAAGKTAADAKKASDAVAEAARAREETLAVQQFYTGEQALLTQGMVYWTREQRTRVYDHAGPGTKTHEGGLLKTWDYNSQRGLSFQAFGNWWGKVTFQVEFKGGSDSAVDLHTYNVAYDKRSDTFKQGAIHMAFMNAHMQVEVWKPNNAVFYLPVDTKTGKVTSVSAYETPIGNPFLLHSDGSFSASGIKANIFDVSTKTVNGMERLYPKKRTIPGTKISVWPAFIEVREVA